MTDPEVVPAQNTFDKDKILLALKAKNPLILVALVCSILILVVLIVILISFLFSSKKYTQQNSVSTEMITNNSTPVSQVTPSQQTPIPTPKPTPRPLPSGPQQYSVSSRGNPEVKMFYISALNTKIGDSQKMSLTIEGSPNSVSSVTVKLITDNKSEDHLLALSSGSNTNGVWSGTWIANDTHDVIYQATVIVKYQKGNDYSFTASFR